VSNAATRICFRLGDTDAKRFADGFSYFDADDLQNLAVGEAIVRVERPENDFNLHVNALDEIEDDLAQQRKNEITARSQKKYGTPKEQVDALFAFPAVTEKKQEPKREEFVDQEQEQELIEPVKKEIAVEQIDQPIAQLTEENKRETTEKLARQKQLSQHRYLQALIKKMAEARGYKATIEAMTPDGQGRVDVSLEKNGKRIACEIGITTTQDWEVHNIEKCLAAGYDVVIAIAKDTKSVRAMELKIEQTVGKASQERILVFETNGLFLYLDMEIAEEATTEKRIKGYRVKVEYATISSKDIQAKKEEITQVILKNKYEP